jgi:hypothetical protein
MMEQVSTMFATLEKIAQSDPKNADIVLIENYGAFQNRLPLVFDLHKFGSVYSEASYASLSVIFSCALGSKKETICYCFMQSLRLG